MPWRRPECRRSLTYSLTDRETLDAVNGLDGIGEPLELANPMSRGATGAAHQPAREHAEDPPDEPAHVRGARG